MWCELIVSFMIFVLVFMFGVIVMMGLLVCLVVSSVVKVLRFFLLVDVIWM